jgi:flagellar protein FlaG
MSEQIQRLSANLANLPTVVATPVPSSQSVPHPLSVQTEIGVNHSVVMALPEVNLQINTEQQHLNLQRTLEQLNQELRDGGRNLNFTIDNSVPEPIVVVKNSDTGEVIRQFPNSAVVSVAHNLQQMRGLFQDVLV